MKNIQVEVFPIFMYNSIYFGLAIVVQISRDFVSTYKQYQ